MPIVLETERLTLRPASDAEMQALIDGAEDDGLRMAYTEMRNGARFDPAHRDFYVAWKVFLRENPAVSVGDLCYKGLPDDGIVEVGYGIDESYRRHGYATEALRAFVAWGLSNDGVRRVEAEAEEANIASIRVLEKNGFRPNGVRGEEGPRFTYIGLPEK